MPAAPLAHTLQPPSPWVMRFAKLIRVGGTVLDLAAGHGRHARALAETGLAVQAADRDAAALAALRRIAGVQVHAADLEAGPWPFAGAAFDAIVVTNYLWRPLLPDLAASLAPDGVLIYETFGVGNEKFGKPSNPAFLLQWRTAGVRAQLRSGRGRVRKRSGCASGAGGGRADLRASRGCARRAVAPPSGQRRGYVLIRIRAASRAWQIAG